MRTIKKILTVLVVLVGIGLLCWAYILWPGVDVNSVSIFPSVIVGVAGIFSFTLTVLINKGKDEWIDIVLPGI